MHISVAVEGDTDAAVAARLLAIAGASASRIFTVSKPEILNRLRGYNDSAHHMPWYVQLDLDDEQCAPSARSLWLPKVADNLCLAIAVREVESWLMADRARLARFLCCAQSALPTAPDGVGDAKGALLQAVRSSRSVRVKARLLPRPHGGRQVGPEYASELIRFAMDHWRPEEARRHSPSLDRAVARIQSLVERWNRP